MPIFVLIHVIIVAISIALSSIIFFKPSIKGLFASYGFIVATVASGTVLLVSSPSHILQSCVAGLFYLTVVSIVTIATHVRIRKLARQEI